MKQVITAAIILALVIATCLFSIWSATSNIETLLDDLDAIQEAYDEDDKDTCQQLSDQFAKDFKKRTQSFSFFMRHSDVTEIENTALSLPVLFEAGDMEHFPAEVATCRNQLRRLYDMELPLPQNIL